MHDFVWCPKRSVVVARKIVKQRACFQAAAEAGAAQEATVVAAAPSSTSHGREDEDGDLLIIVVPCSIAQVWSHGCLSESFIACRCSNSTEEQPSVLCFQTTKSCL